MKSKPPMPPTHCPRRTAPGGRDVSGEHVPGTCPRCGCDIGINASSSDPLCKSCDKYPARSETPTTDGIDRGHWRGHGSETPKPPHPHEAWLDWALGLLDIETRPVYDEKIQLAAAELATLRAERDRLRELLMRLCGYYDMNGKITIPPWAQEALAK
jgi:hypothetical protein